MNQPLETSTMNHDSTPNQLPGTTDSFGSESSDEPGDFLATEEGISTRATSIKAARKRRKRRERKGLERYCNGCWRVEGHYPLNRNIAKVWLLSIGTLGIYLLFRRYKCRICGKVRINYGD